MTYLLTLLFFTVCYTALSVRQDGWTTLRDRVFWIVPIGAALLLSIMIICGMVVTGVVIFISYLLWITHLKRLQARR